MDAYAYSLVPLSQFRGGGPQRGGVVDVGPSPADGHLLARDGVGRHRQLDLDLDVLFLGYAGRGASVFDDVGGDDRTPWHLGDGGLRRLADQGQAAGQSGDREKRADAQGDSWCDR
ncbi:hypothetical protein ACFQX6_37445 [Streptosporangium lutulentum]